VLVSKCVVEKIAMISTKHLHNQIAGFFTHLMKLILAGPVRDIIMKFQEEEHKQRDT